MKIAQLALQTTLPQLQKKRYALQAIATLLLGITISDNVIALTATTTKEIQGNKPYLHFKANQDNQVGNKLNSLNELLGLKIPSETNNGELKQIGIMDSISYGGKPLRVPEGTKFSDIIALVAADSKEHDLSTLLQVVDNDGDASIAENTAVLGSLKATWKDGNKRVESDLNQELTQCGGPYTLELSIKDIAATTKYGIPDNNYYGSKPQITYQFMLLSGPKLCYVQPFSMRVFSGAQYSTKYPDGYNPAVWEPTFSIGWEQLSGGFKPESFRPITGFKGIGFNIMGSGTDQSKYRCKLDDSNINNWVTLSSGNAGEKVGLDCKVVYNSLRKPTSPLTINMEYLEDKNSNWINIGKVTIPTPQKWGIVIDHDADRSSKGFSNEMRRPPEFTAYNVCRKVIDGHAIPETTREQVNDFSDAGKAWRQKYMYRRNEFINSVDADLPEGTLIGEKNYMHQPSRDFGTFLGEWGALARYVSAGFYWWTSEMYQADRPFAIDGFNAKGIAGSGTFALNGIQSAQTLCRGENLPLEN
jgi:hypothetical protein